MSSRILIFGSNGKIDIEITNRLRKVTRVYAVLNKAVSGKKDIQEKLSFRCTNSIIALPTLLYGSETWVRNMRLKSRINAAEMKQVMKIVGKTKIDRLRNEIIREELNQEPIVMKINKRKLNSYGHVKKIECKES